MRPLCPIPFGIRKNTYFFDWTHRSRDIANVRENRTNDACSEVFSFVNFSSIAIAVRDYKCFYTYRNFIARDKLEAIELKPLVEEGVNLL